MNLRRRQPADAKIYGLVDPETNLVRYVGWTVRSLPDRLRSHINDRHQATLRQFDDPEARAAVSRVHKGKQISREHPQIMSAATKKRLEARRAAGGATSDETRAKISAARKGRPLSDEHKANISRATKGKPHSAEHRAKLAAANRARAATGKG